jgi:hypothetical protein
MYKKNSADDLKTSNLGQSVNNFDQVNKFIK